MLLAEMIESRTASGAQEAIRRLLERAPTKARRINEEGEEEIAANDLQVGDRIRVRPGDNVQCHAKGGIWKVGAENVFVLLAAVCKQQESMDMIKCYF